MSTEPKSTSTRRPRSHAASDLTKKNGTSGNGAKSRGDATMDVPALRGQQGSSVYYVINLAFGTVVKLFQWDPAKMSSLPVEDRHQRALTTSRVPGIAKYVVDNEDYVFSSVTTSVNADDLAFTPIHEDGSAMGWLTLPMEAEWIINDGQHRLAAVQEAMSIKADLKGDTISVMILQDPSLARCQQIFSDLNRNARRTSASLDIAFDHRSPLNQLTNRIVRELPLFAGRTDEEHTALSRGSPYFTTLSALGAAIKELRAPTPEVALDFFRLVTAVVTPWEDIAEGRVDPAFAREYYLSLYAVTLRAVASAGRVALGRENWQEHLRRLQDVDWRKDNPDWLGIVVDGDGKVVTRAPSRKAMTDYLLAQMGLGEKPSKVLDVPNEVPVEATE